MSRTKHPTPPARWNIIVPASLAQSIDDLLLDPHTNRTRYGERSRLITTLLLAHLRSLPPTPPTPPLDLSKI